MSDNAAKIAKLRREADQLEAADKAFRGLPDEQQLAITLHTMPCHHNHTDGCSWEYENRKTADGVYEADWAGYAHEQYLTKARTVLGYCEYHNIQPSAAIELVKLVNRS